MKQAIMTTQTGKPRFFAPAFKKTFVSLSVFLFFSAGCSSLEEEEPRRRARRDSVRSNKARAEKALRARPTPFSPAARAEARPKESPFGDDRPAARGIASFRDNMSFNESGLDFLSKKLEDAVSGYTSLHEKISSLENRLSRLIFLLEAKAHAVAQREEELEEEEEDAVLTESEEISPYAEAEEATEESGKPDKKREAIPSSGKKDSGPEGPEEGEGGNESALPPQQSDESR